jgi:hypothetical protein
MYSMIILAWKPIVIHINLFNHIFLFFMFWKGPYWLAHYQFFWDIGHSPIEAPVWTASCKIETNVLPMGHLFTLYTRELTFGQTMWNQNEVLHATFWGTTWGTSWERIGNMMGTREKRKIFLLILSRKERTGPVMSPCWAFHWLHGTFISKALRHHIWPELMAWNSPKKGNNHTPPPLTKKKNSAPR